jgi:phosphonate transport system permease protein
MSNRNNIITLKDKVHEIPLEHRHFIKGDDRQRYLIAAIVCLMSLLYALGLYVLEINPFRVFTGMGELGKIAWLMLPPDPETWERALRIFWSLVETISIAFLGTLLAALIAFPLGFLAARNIVSIRLPQFLMRRGLDSLRGIDTLIWALIWINVVGMGPFAGVLAIMCSDIGSFGKLFSEAIEAADRKPVEGVKSSGGSHLDAIRLAIIPQIMPVILSQVLYYFESNTRSATIIGIVGAGGIGLYLAEQIRTLEWQQASYSILLILIAVAIIDALSSRIRFAIIGTPRH